MASTRYCTPSSTSSPVVLLLLPNLSVHVMLIMDHQGWRKAKVRAEREGIFPSTDGLSLLPLENEFNMNFFDA